MRTSALFLVLLFATTSLVHAQGPSPAQAQAIDAIPSFVLAGLEEYRNKNIEEAVKIWLRGSASEGMGIGRRSEELRKFVENDGAFQSWELMSTRNYSSRFRTLYLVLHFDKRPVFARFDVYQSDLGWILLNNYAFNEDPDKILPACAVTAP
jgi:hypothetical protein